MENSMNDGAVGGDGGFPYTHEDYQSQTVTCIEASCGLPARHSIDGMMLCDEHRLEYYAGKRWTNDGG